MEMVDQGHCQKAVEVAQTAVHRLRGHGRLFMASPHVEILTSRY